MRGRAIVTTLLAMSSWVERARAALQRSVWVPVGLRVTGIAALMLGLAAVGASSVVSATRGAPAVSAPRDGPQPATGWLASASPHAVRSAEAPVPSGGAPAAARPPPEGSGEHRSNGVAADGRVVLNRASPSELTRLPGVGDKRAAAIVSLRKRLGRFRRITDLLRVRGIGPKTLRRMRPHLVLDAPEPQKPSNPPPAPSAPRP